VSDTPHDVFISYSSKDKPTADAICAMLERNGIRCWIAPRDVLPGAEWAAAIIQAINDARVFVLLFSEASNTSAQIRREVERAANREIPIIPFRVSDIAPNQSLEYFISTPHWMDAFLPPLERHIQQLSIHIARILAKPVPGQLDPDSTERRAPPRATSTQRPAWLLPCLVGAGVVVLAAILFVSLSHRVAQVPSQAPSPSAAPSAAPPSASPSAAPPSAAPSAAPPSAASAAHPVVAPPPPSREGNDLSGTWVVSAMIESNGQMAATATPVCTFQQAGARITGTCEGPNALGPASGAVTGDKVAWKWVANAYTAQGTSMTVSFHGMLGHDGVVRGTVTASGLRGLVGHFTQQRQ
jgi:hypothetical protein